MVCDVWREGTDAVKKEVIVDIFVRLCGQVNDMTYKVRPSIVATVADY